MAAAGRATFERELQDLRILPGPLAAEFMDTGYSRELEILPPDERRHWSRTLLVPYRWICSIELYRADPRGAMLLHGKGTGVLIGPDCVLTAAHLLWRQENGQPRRVDRVVVIPARDGTTRPFGRVQAAEWRTAASWDVRKPLGQQWRWDFALIRLKEAIGNKPYPALRGGQLGWWGSASLGGGTSVKPLKADWLKGRQIISAGYPGDKCGTRRLADERAIQRCARDEPEIWASTQWLGMGIVRRLDPARGLLYHTIDTHEGQSGSPVWYYWRDPKLGQVGYSLVGLHVAPGTFEVDAQGSNQRRVDNAAVWISQDVLDEIARLKRELAPTGAGRQEHEAEAENGPSAARPDLGVSAKQATAYDWAFDGNEGKRFRALVEWAAGEVGLNPGLLADTLLAETRRSSYLARGEVSSFEVGTDDFYAKRKDIERKVPAYANVRWDPRRVTENVNETGRTVKSVRFASGRDATLASAVYLKHGEVVLSEAARAAGGDFDALAVETRFALVRLAFNAGHGRATTNLAEALSNRDILIRKPQKKAGPQRRATIHLARAMRLSERVFGVTPR